MHNNSDEDCIQSIFGVIEQEKNARSSLDERWLQWWRLYKTEPLRIANDNEWRSKLNDGRVFEIIETIATYLRSALFYSDNWVNLEANEPGLAEVLPIVNAYFRDCLNHSNLKREIRVFLRQLLLTGFSGMTVVWEDEKLVFKNLDSFNVFFESSRRLDCNSYVFVRHYVNYPEFIDLVDAGTLDYITSDEADDYWEKLKTSNNSTENKQNYLEDVDEVFGHVVELYEYWCPTEKKIFRLIDGECYGEEEAPVCPWLIMTLFELPNASYGLGVLDSSIGLILENNCIMNRRLDNMAVSVDNMWLMVDDGVISEEDLKTEPGKILKVANKDALTPLYPPANNFSVTYNESAIIDQKIEKNTGTGALISSGAYRSGERVTAQEINAVKEAGGNRLTDVYEHIESTFVIPLLRQALELLRNNLKKSKVIKLASDRPNVYDYFKMLPSDLKKDYSVKVTASQNVINRDRNMRRMQEFIQTVVAVPQFSEQVDYTTLFEDMVTQFGFDNPQRYMKKQMPQEQQQEPTTATPTSPSDAFVQGMTEISGDVGKAAALGSVASGDFAQMAQQMAGVPQEGQTPDSAQTAEANLMLNTPM